MNKTLRNKALRDTTRLIVATYNGQDWACPDGYFATSKDIYDGYKIKISQRKMDYLPKPELDKVLNSSVYGPADSITEVEQDFVDVSSKATDITYRVNKVYFDLLKHLHPEATVNVAIDGNKHADVRFIEVGQLVAVIMPVKQ